jgi:hypothetical protein
MKAKQGFKLRPLGDEYILIGESVEQINFNKMITMNESAAYLWKNIQGTDFDADLLTKLLLEEYDIDEATARQDATQLIAKWQEAGIIA